MTEKKHGEVPGSTWRHGAAWGTILFVLYVLAAAAPALLALGLAPAFPGFLENLSLGCALTAFAILVLQVVLAARLRWADQPFGLDLVMQFHARAALLAGILLLCHPLLLMLSHESTRLLSFQTPWAITLGKAALVLLWLGILFALFFHRLGVDYNRWRFMHKGMVAVIILAFIHSLQVGPDIQEPAMKAWWWLLFAVAALLFLFRNLVVPVWLRRRFRVGKVERESHDTYTLTFEPVDGRPLRRNPGQFMFLGLLRPGRPSETHPFTISAAPSATGILQATIKRSGDFTDTIDQTRMGDEARIEAPYGRFSLVHHDWENLVFIAGGVGITPIMSMLRHLEEGGDKRRVLLLYGNGEEKDILFREELDRQGEQVRVVHVLAEAGEGWPGRRGFIDRRVLEEEAASLLESGGTHIFLCGPPAMMDKVIDHLRSLGVPDSRVHYERFTL